MRVSELRDKLKDIQDRYGDLVVGDLQFPLDGDRVWSYTITPCVVTYPKKCIREEPITQDDFIVIFD